MYSATDFIRARDHFRNLDVEKALAAGTDPLIEPPAAAPAAPDGSAEATLAASDAPSIADGLAAPEKHFFERKFEAIAHEVPFNKDWPNATGYFNGVLSDKDLQALLKPGQQAKSTDPNGRQLIFTATHFGIVVVFQRYKDGYNTLCYQAPDIIHRLGLIRSTVQVKEAELEFILGSIGDSSVLNLGKHIAYMKQELDKVFPPAKAKP